MMLWCSALFGIGCALKRDKSGRALSRGVFKSQNNWHCFTAVVYILIMTLEQDMSVILVSPESSEHLQEKRGSVASGSEVDTADKRDGTVVHDVVVIAQLRARVEQQSSLIGMMKQRNDDTFMQVS